MKLVLKEVLVHFKTAKQFTLALGTQAGDEQGMSNAWFKAQGLIRMWDQWMKAQGNR